MLSVKVVLVSACLASAVYGNPTFDLIGLKKGLGGSGKGLFGQIPGGPIGGIIHAIVGGVDAKLATDADLIKNLLTLNIPGAFKDIFHFIDILQQTFSNIVGSVFPEFGVACRGLSQTCTRIASCLFGGDFGNVDCNGLPRRHGKGPVDLTKYSSQLGLDKIRKQVQAFISKIKNKGGNLSGSETAMISLLSSWLSIFESKSFGVHDVSKSMTIQITVMAVLAESREAGSGRTMVNQIYPMIAPMWKKSGYPDISLDEILNKLKNISDNCGFWSKGAQGNNGRSVQRGNENGSQDESSGSDQSSLQSRSDEDN